MKRTCHSVCLVLLLALLPWTAQADICVVDDAVVTAFFQWEDGSIFVSINKPTGCGCSENFRAAFHKNDNEKVHVAIALTALATGKKVFLRADNINGTCPIHGNTARLLTLLIKNN